MIQHETKSYVEFFFGGSFYAETNTVEWSGSDPQTIEVPEHAFGFRTYKVEIMMTVVEGVEFTKRSKQLDRSGMFYPGGRMVSLEDIRAQHGERSILYQNIKGNGYTAAVEDRFGGYHFYDIGKDHILPLA